VGLFDDKSVNETPSGNVPVVGVPLKLAIGTGGLTVIVVPDEVELPPVFETVRFAVHFPAVG
jgi:hypothetical protein